MVAENKGKHDIYLMYLTKEEITTSEKWIDELQEEYNGALTVNAKYGNEKQLIEQKEKEELNRQHVMKLWEEEFQLSLIHISEPTRRVVISYAVFCLKKKKR